MTCTPLAHPISLLCHIRISSNAPHPLTLSPEGEGETVAGGEVSLAEGVP